MAHTCIGGPPPSLAKIEHPTHRRGLQPALFFFHMNIPMQRRSMSIARATRPAHLPLGAARARPHSPIRRRQRPTRSVHLPFCLPNQITTPADNRGTVPTSIASKVFIEVPEQSDDTIGPTWKSACDVGPTSDASRAQPGESGTASQTPQASSTATAAPGRRLPNGNG